MKEYQDIIKKLVDFRDERDWEQFHDSKNLALALSIEAAELNEIFLWKKETDAESIDVNKLKEELADVLAYAFLLAHKHDIDIFEIVKDKIIQNGLKYPVTKSKGKSTKYNNL